jgi:DNA-binding NarL/FixJ family response regulator
MRGDEMSLECSMVLVVAREASSHQTIRRTMGHLVAVIETDSIADATKALAGSRWAGFIVDLSLPDGDGLDWLESVRPAHRRAQVLVMGETCEPQVIARAFELHAHYLCRPIETKHLSRFAERLAPQASDALSIAQRLAAQYHLTPCELEILTASLRGVSRDEFVETRGISINTYKTQVRSVLRKTSACRIGDVRDTILRSMDESVAVGSTGQEARHDPTPGRRRS